MDYKNTIESLKNANLILDRDLVVIGREAPSTAAVLWGGAIGGALSAANKDDYIVSVNSGYIRFFEIDRKTGNFKNVYHDIHKNEIIKLSVSTFSRSLFLKTSFTKNQYNFVPKYKGYVQKEELKAFLTYLKENYRK